MPAWYWHNITTAVITVSPLNHIMQVYRNDHYIQRRAKGGRYASFAGMGVLFLGLLVTWFAGPEWVSLSFLALILGFVLTQVGLYYTNRFGRPDRPDQVLVKALKGFDDRYQLFQFTSPAGNVLVTPAACIVFAIKMHHGAIRYQNGKWKHSTRLRSFFLWMASDSLGNPVKDAEIETDSLRRYLAKNLPGVEVPIQPVILFGSPAAEVDAGESPIPAIHYKKLKDWLRGPGKNGGLSADTRDQLIELLSPPSATVETENAEEESE